MKSFQDYLRVREGMDNPMGLTASDTGLRPKDDRPMDHDSEAQIAKLVQVAKISCHKHPDLMKQLLGRVAEKDEEVRASLDAIQGKTFRDRGLGHLGSDRLDQVMPNSADSNNGGDDVD